MADLMRLLTRTLSRRGSILYLFSEPSFAPLFGHRVLYSPCRPLPHRSVVRHPTLFWASPFGLSLLRHAQSSCRRHQETPISRLSFLRFCLRYFSAIPHRNGLKAQYRYPMTESPNHAMQLTAPRVTSPAPSQSRGRSRAALRCS